MSKIRWERPHKASVLPFKPGFYASASPSSDTLELSIMGDIGNTGYGGGITADSIKRAIDNAPSSVTHCSLVINSVGGCAVEGIACFGVLRDSGLHVSAKVLGIAASAASVVMCAASDIRLSLGSLVMVHNAWGVCQGFATDMKKQAEVLQTISGSMAKIYADRTGLSIAECQKLQDEETWMSSPEAMQLGFCDGLCCDDDTGNTDDDDDDSDDDNKKEEEAFAMARQSPLLSFYARVPDRLRKR